jgi:hypothetical protein
MEALAALVPSIGVGLLFWWAIRAIINADRSERQALAELDRREREAAGGTGQARLASDGTTVDDVAGDSSG